jgi:hypothetical protein
MMLEQQEYDWNMSIDDRHDVFVPHHLCITPEDTSWLPEPGMVPNKELWDWLDAHTTFYIHSPWSDGCSLYLIQPSNEVLVELKIRFPEVSA